MVSREDHCLADLLWRHRRGELEMDLARVIPNHDDLRDEVQSLPRPRGVPGDQHPSLVPAGVRGADPYQRAHARGVKSIGATAYYATEDLDEGPIIAQEVRRAGHSDTIEDLIRVGRDVERLTLARALRSHLDDRVIVHDGRTIIL